MPPLVQEISERFECVIGCGHVTTLSWFAAKPLLGEAWHANAELLTLAQQTASATAFCCLITSGFT